eukprot:jgi/Undpi1/5710/HiC_scaffold_2.g00984.m1
MYMVCRIFCGKYSSPLNYELVGTAKEPIDVSVLYPKQWTVTKTPGKGISIQDYKYTDRAFSLSRPLPSGKKNVDELPVSYFTDALFNLDGPYGNFGKVDDFKVVGAKTLVKGKRTYRYVDLKFSAPTQGLLQVERRACVASTIVGSDVVIFTASILASRWGKISPVVAEMIIATMPPPPPPPLPPPPLIPTLMLIPPRHELPLKMGLWALIWYDHHCNAPGFHMGKSPALVYDVGGYEQLSPPVAGGAGSELGAGGRRVGGVVLRGVARHFEHTAWFCAAPPPRSS